MLSLSLGSLSFGSCDKLCKRDVEKNGGTYADCFSYLTSQFQVCMFGSQDIEDRVDVEFQKLGLKGVTVLASSGDGGSHFAFGPFGKSSLNEIICDEMNMPV